MSRELRQMQVEEMAQNQMETEPEAALLLNMTEEEALNHLGLKKVAIYQGLEQILSERPAWARMIAEFMMEQYPEQLPVLLAKNELTKILDSRVEEAKEMYSILHPQLQEREKVSGMDTMQRIKTENQINQEIMEIISRTILYRPMTF